MSQGLSRHQHSLIKKPCYKLTGHQKQKMFLISVLCVIHFCGWFCVPIISEIRGSVSAVESCTPAGFRLQARQRSAAPLLWNQRCILMSLSTSCTHWPFRPNFPVAGSDPGRFEQGLKPGPSLLRFWRRCKVYTEVSALMYFEPLGCSDQPPKKYIAA